MSQILQWMGNTKTYKIETQKLFSKWKKNKLLELMHLEPNFFYGNIANWQLEKVMNARKQKKIDLYFFEKTIISKFKRTKNVCP